MPILAELTVTLSYTVHYIRVQTATACPHVRWQLVRLYTTGCRWWVSKLVGSNSGKILPGDSWYWEDNLFQWQSVQHKPHMDWPALHSRRPATNCLGHSIAVGFSWYKHLTCGLMVLVCFAIVCSSLSVWGYLALTSLSCHAYSQIPNVQTQCNKFIVLAHSILSLQDEYISTGSFMWRPSIQNAPKSGYIPGQINSATATDVSTALSPTDIPSVDTSQLMVTNQYIIHIYTKISYPENHTPPALQIKYIYKFK